MLLNRNRLTAALLLALALCSGAARAQAAPDPLREGFANPPAAARPRVWWHWMNGNITEDGITRDLEWMSRIGIGGVQNFDASFATPLVVPTRLAYMTPPWREAFRHAVGTADRLGLEFSIAGSPGWSESGGPWVKLGQAMKKLVWSETTLPGGQHYHVKLAPPPSNPGRYQDQPLSPGLTPDMVEPPPNYYRDAVVVAFPVPADEGAPIASQVTGNDQPIDAQLLSDGHLEHGVVLAFAADGSPAQIKWDFGRAQTVRSLTLAFAGTTRYAFRTDPQRLQAQLQASDDGVRYRAIASLYDSAIGQRTLSFAPVTARYFRLQLPRPSPTTPSIEVTESRLLSAPRVNRAEEKAAFFVGDGLEDSPTPSATGRQVIASADVLDLSARLAADGTLDWVAPPGNWLVLRLGYSLVGVMNHPASQEGTGLEVDKLSSSHVKAYIEEYLNRYAEVLGPQLMGAHGLRGLVNDSWEAGAQNWTEELPRQFRMRRGYELLRWLPALTGRIVDSSGATDAFLWDYRRTLGEMLTDNHYGVLDQAVRERGLTHYVESHEVGRAFIGDGMDVKRGSDIPMSAMWVGGAPAAHYDADVRESASVAHLYGQNLVAAESFTAAGPAFAYAPADLKATADRLLADGLNRFVIHTSVHQPLAQGPGVTLGPFGQYFTRHETWAEQAGAWVSYLSRSAFLLQQGHFSADILYYYGEDSNLTSLYPDGLPSMPQGYAFDFANAHAISLLKVEEGALTTASGMRYRVLALAPRARVMSLSVLRQIASLVAAGATVVGDPPVRTPSLADDTTQFRSLVEAVWGVDPGAVLHAYGKGRVIRSAPLQNVLTALGAPPDFMVAPTEAAADVVFVHRVLPDAELYFVSNRKSVALASSLSFRITGKVPELWYADTGRRVPASYRMQAPYTTVDVPLDAGEALFVVFRDAARATARSIVAPVREQLASLQGPWQLSFQPDRGAPPTVTFPQLQSWTQNADAGIKYFSGTATYRRPFVVKREWLAQGRGVELDLGSVRDLAEVLVNGKSLGVVWKAPFRIDVTPAVKAGRNELEVRVTNLWPNRLIGDQQPGATRIATSTLQSYKADSPLRESGLLGPVALWGITGSALVEGGGLKTP